MNTKSVRTLAASAALIAAACSFAASAESVVVTPADLKWKDMGVPGLVAAAVSGDMDKGSSRFFLKYPAGLVTPMHHHTTDHYVTVVSGTITLTVGGKDHKLGPGSYFALTNKAAHAARVEGKEAALFFIEADGPWDVVMEK